MRQSLVIRLVLLLVCMLAAVVYLAPSFVSGLWFLPENGIRLGLDLQGGSHLVLEVEVEKAVENRMRRIRSGIRDELRERGIAFTGLDIDDSGELVIAASPDNMERIRELLSTEFPQLEVSASSAGAGGAELRMAFAPRELDSIHNFAVDQTLETIRNRIDQFGVTEPTIQRQGQRDILVQLPGIQDPERAKALIGKTALLEFKLVDERGDVEQAVRSGPPPGREVLYGYEDTASSSVRRTKIPYLLEARTLMTGEAIADANVRRGDQLEGLYVELALNSVGSTAFDRLTAENVGRLLAIVLDGRVYSAPQIRERISGGVASITGNFNFQEARDLAIVLRAGALPAPVEILEERTVGPSLGRDSVRKGVFSFILGSILVLIFMVAYYRGAGVLADVALVLNIFFMMAILAGFEAVLTLPGIAGIILTMGMAVDANVLINERIREEVRTGKSPRTAVDTGYERAIPAILDSNLTTFLAGVILFQFGTGPVRGFAVTLCVGILTTVISAVYGTRIYYDYRLAKRNLAELSV